MVNILMFQMFLRESLSLMGIKAAPEINPKIKDVAVTCINPLAHIRSHKTAAVLQYVELYSLLVIPAVEHANEAV